MDATLRRLARTGAGRRQQINTMAPAARGVQGCRLARRSTRDHIRAFFARRRIGAGAVVS